MNNDLYFYNRVIFKSVMLRSHFSRKERRIGFRICSVDICMQRFCMFDDVWQYGVEERKDNFNNQLGHCPFFKVFIKLFEPLENTASTLFCNLLMFQRTCKLTHMYEIHSSLSYSIEPIFHSSKLIIL